MDFSSNIELVAHINDGLCNPSLSVEERISQIYQLPEWVSHVDERLRYREYRRPENSEDSLAQLIDWYTNKKSKCVRYAGVKLRKAFLELPAADQRKVGMALLTGSKTDTEWVCKRLDNYKPDWDKDWVVNWHPDYAPLVEAVWKKYEGKFCGRLLIQFLDKEVVRSHMTELLKYDDLYFGLCRRFVAEPWFSVDTDRLSKCTSINAYLSVMSQTSDGISEEEARRLLFQWIATIAAMLKGKYCTFRKEEIFWRYRMDEHRVIYAWGIDTAIYYLLKMNLNNVVEDFLRWDQLVYTTYYSQLRTEEDSSDNQERFVDVILECLPDEYKRFACIDETHYQYAISAAQPFTQPRIQPYYREYEQQSTPFLDYPIVETDVDPYSHEYPF